MPLSSKLTNISLSEFLILTNITFNSTFLNSTIKFSNLAKVPLWVIISPHSVQKLWWEILKNSAFLHPLYTRCVSVNFCVVHKSKLNKFDNIFLNYYLNLKSHVKKRHELFVTFSFLINILCFRYLILIWIWMYVLILPNVGLSACTFLILYFISLLWNRYDLLQIFDTFRTLLFSEQLYFEHRPFPASFWMPIAAFIIIKQFFICFPMK